MAHNLISHSLNERNKKVSEGERIVEVSEEVLNQLHSTHYFSKTNFIYALSIKRAWLDQEEEKETNKLI